eukprot:TRINITY_DN39998_c0_g1_i1.p1 TRINITY_DN39998_c0_g1~~TRINITY_DN39998_c0_g1_i1.p1  ORF type:complete len:274 (-),score=62.71 TRINITY_DN39998_c0_g1_i1:1-822(-)
MNSKSALPASLKVKNTFIDVRSAFVDEDSMEAFAAMSINNSRRQCSEPAMSMQMLGRQDSQVSEREDGATLGMTIQQRSNTMRSEMISEGVCEVDEDDERDEPETEIEPVRNAPLRQVSRDSIALDCTASFPLGRQETEQMWPTWGQAPEELRETKGALMPSLLDQEFTPGIDPSRMWMFDLANGMDNSFVAAHFEGSSKGYGEADKEDASISKAGKTDSGRWAGADYIGFGGGKALSGAAAQEADAAIAAATANGYTHGCGPEWGMGDRPAE